MVRQALHTRERYPQCFGAEVIAAVPRLLMSCGDWDTYVEIPEGRWTNQMTGEQIQGERGEAGSLLRHFPVALLAREQCC